jgi:hypothetical protein
MSRSGLPLPPNPLDREDLRQRVQKSLDAFLATQMPVLDGISNELGALTDALTDLHSELGGR